MKRYTTQEVAKAIGVGYQTLLRWLYGKKLAEPERMLFGGQNLRLWTTEDIQRAKKYKKEGAEARRSRKGKGTGRRRAKGKKKK